MSHETNLILYYFISGGAVVASAIAGLFFFKFWKQTKDHFFQIFAWAFWVLSIERALPILLQISDEFRTYVYMIRLAAFALIFLAIVVKNRKTQHC